MSKPLIMANWKLNPDSSEEVVFLAKKSEAAAAAVRSIDVAIAPPFPFLASAKKVLRKAHLGAQNVFWEEKGPYTGEVSASQLKDLGVKYVIIGHSERRYNFAETDEAINKKILAALNQNLTPVLCIGEKERSGNEIPTIVGEQLKAALKKVKQSKLKNLVIAYEPVWAISTNPGARPDTPENAFRAVVYIRRLLATIYSRRLADSVRIIYGGSVNAKNVFSFLKEGNMQGALVGKASLDSQEFREIIRQASIVK